MALCRDLGLQTVADGVETADQLAVVRSLGIDHAQGFLLGRPVVADDVVASMPTWVGAQPLRRAAQHSAT